MVNEFLKMISTLNVIVLIICTLGCIVNCKSNDVQVKSRNLTDPNEENLPVIFQEVERNDYSHPWTCIRTPKSFQCTLYRNSEVNAVLRHIIGKNLTNEVFALELVVFYTTNHQNFINPINLTLLRYFTELRELSLYTGFRVINVLFRLLYDNDTFENLPKITKIIVNLCLCDNNFYNTVKPLVNLKIFDLSNTRLISYATMIETIKGLNDNIERLFLRHFQTVGAPGSSATLDVDKFFGRKYQNLTEIDLSHNGFTTVSPGISKLFPNMEIFTIHHNQLITLNNRPFLYEILMLPNLIEADLGNQGYEQELDEWQLEAAQSIRLLEIRNTNDTFSECLTKYTNENISNLFDPTQNTSAMLCEILKICISQGWGDFPCHLLPQTDAFLDPSCPYGFRFPLGRKIRIIFFSSVYLETTFHFVSDTLLGCVCFGWSSLRKLEFGNNAYWINNIYKKQSDGYYMHLIQSLDNLTEVSIENNDLYYNMNELVIGFPLIEKLNASFNSILVWAEENASLCPVGKPTFLKEVDFTNALRIVIPDITYLVKNCENLTTLILKKNWLLSNKSLSLVGLKNFKFLDISDNSITALNKLFMDELKNAHKQGINFTIDLSNNPLECGCNSIKFAEWLVDTGVHIIKNFNATHCLHYDSSSILVTYINIWQLKAHCYNVIPIATSIASGLTVLLAIVCCNFISKYRFRIQYQIIKCTKSCRKYSRAADSTEEEPNYEYDVFVSYCGEDRFWVQDVLMKILEDKYGLKLVIHHRDFPIGQPIIDSIEANMDKSRELMVVISDVSLRSDWCKYELRSAHERALQRNKDVIVVKLGDLPADIEDSTARVLLDRHTFLEWKPAKAGQKLFWSRLVAHLYGEEFTCICCRTGRPAISYTEVQQFTDGAE